MPLSLNYPNVATFVLVESTGYGATKQVVDQADVNVIFEQDTNFQHSGNQDAITADAICWPDINNSFVQEYSNRLEGAYILMELYGSDASESWYKVESCVIRRDHLLTNSIDNIELFLKKTSPIPGVS
jgi:hypothetical protein